MKTITYPDTVFRLGAWVQIPNWAFPRFSRRPFELGRIVGGMSIIEGGIRTTLYQVRNLRDRHCKPRVPSDFASFYPPSEITPTSISYSPATAANTPTHHA